jgi:hypothetical protein
MAEKHKAKNSSRPKRKNNSSSAILPTIKQKKRFVAIRISKDENFEELYSHIKNYFGLQKLAESGFMHLKEFDFAEKTYSYYVFKINPKYLEQLYQAIIFNRFDADIVKVFGNVRKFKEFANKVEEAADEETKKENSKNNFDIIKLPKSGIKTIFELEKAINDVKQNLRYDLKYIIFAMHADLALSFDEKELTSFIEKNSKSNRFVFYIENPDEMKSVVRLYERYKIELPYIWSFSSYEEINIIEAYKNAKIKPFAIFSLESNRKSDFLRFRNSNMNDVIAKFFAEKKIFYGLDLSLVWNAQNKNVVLGRVFQNLRLCRQFKVPILIASLSRFDKIEMKNPKNVIRALESFKLTDIMFEDIFS